MDEIMRYYNIKVNFINGETCGYGLTEIDFNKRIIIVYDGVISDACISTIIPFDNIKLIGIKEKVSD